MKIKNWCYIPKHNENKCFGNYEVQFEEGEILFLATCECDNCETVYYQVHFEDYGNNFWLEQIDCNCRHCKEYVDFDFLQRDISVFIQEQSQAASCESCIHKFNYEIMGKCEEHYLPIKV